MLNWIFEDEEYTALYHQYFAEFLSSVDIQGIIDDAYNLIKSYVAKDPTAFYTYEEFELGVETLRQFCSMRSESISLQLENGETTENMSYVDASGITLSDMGSMSGMGGFGGDMPSMPGGMEGFDGVDFGNAPGTEVPDNAKCAGGGGRMERQPVSLPWMRRMPRPRRLGRMRLRMRRMRLRETRRMVSIFPACRKILIHPVFRRNFRGIFRAAFQRANRNDARCVFRHGGRRRRQPSFWRRGAGTGRSVPLKLDGDFFFLAGGVDLDRSFGRHSGYRLDHRQEIQKLMG